jgi:hypothetical protein
LTAIEAAVRIVVDLLVRRQYETIQKLTCGRRLSAKELRSAVEDYGRELVPPAEGWWQTVDVTPVRDVERPEFHIAAPLWTREEGRSDLTLELRLLEARGGSYETQVLDLHVL